MKKKIVALSMALVVFVGSTITSQATVMADDCPSPHAVEGQHYYADTKVTGGHTEFIGYHSYATFDDNNNAVMRYDCKLSQAYEHRIKVCRFCGAEDRGSAETVKLDIIYHSIQHQ